MKVVTYFHTGASASVTVDITNDELYDLAAENDCKVEELDDYYIITLASEKASNEGFGGLCAHCSGFDEKWSQDIGDWEPDEGEDTGKIIER